MMTLKESCHCEERSDKAIPSDSYYVGMTLFQACAFAMKEESES